MSYANFLSLFSLPLSLRRDKIYIYIYYYLAAPYVQIDMNPHLPGVGETTVHKDAIIFAGHKFIGGVQSPGVLVTKRSLLKDKIATEDMRDSHHYHRDAELREESGTAGVVEAIRCGLAVQLKENVTPRAIVARQDKISRYAFHFLSCVQIRINFASSSSEIACFDRADSLFAETGAFPRA